MIALWTLGAALAAPPDVAPATAGQWRLAHDRAALKAETDAAIERSIEDFNVAFRVVARKKFEGLVEPCPGYAFAWTDDAVQITCGAKGSVTVPTSGARGSFVNEDGDTVPVTYAGRQGGFSITFTGEEGGQTTVYDFDGDALVVSKTIFSDRLARSLQWSMRYAR